MALSEVIFEQSLTKMKMKMKKGAVQRGEGRDVPGAASAKALVWACRGRDFRTREEARRAGAERLGDRSGRWEDRAEEAGVV